MVYHPVAFVSNGGSSVHGGEAAHNTAVNRPDDPTRAGHAFGGWYSDAALTSAYNFASPVTAPITLYAKWTINTHAVTVNANPAIGGTATGAAIYNYGALVTITASPNPGYTFSGWTVNSGGVTLSTTTPTSATFTMPDNAVTITANFTIKTYTVSFNTGGGAAVSAQNITHGGTIAEPAPPFTGAIEGWYTEAGFTNKWDFTTTVTSSFTLYANWAYGSGTAEKPFEITEDNFADVLNYIRTAEGLTKDYLLTTDITLPDDGVHNWTAIGTDANRFTGTFDGGGHTISNLTIINTGNNQGMFGYIGNNGNVKNLVLADVSITARQYIGGIAGHNRGIVENCFVTGTVTGSVSWVGGLVGTNSGTVQNCYAIVDVSSSDYQVGGLVGVHHQNSTVQNCYAAGSVSGTASVGGLVGQCAGTVQNSVALTSIVVRKEGGTSTNFGRVAGNITVNGTLTNNYAREDMWVMGNKVTTGTGAATIHGEGVLEADSRTQSWWWTAPGGPGWEIHDSQPAAKAAVEADPDTASPWWWDGSPDNGRPRLWFENGD